MHDQLLSLQTSLLDWAEPDARPFFQNWRCALIAWDEWQSRCHRSRAEIRLNLNLHLYAIWVFFWVLMQQHFTIPARLGLLPRESCAQHRFSKVGACFSTTTSEL